MPQYDFSQLSPNDLEHLVRDLLQAEWSIRLESFKSGRDGGIDLRHSKGTANLIVQVKHYVRTGFRGLLRDLKDEDSKIRRIEPSRYAVATSVPLSPANKESILDALPSAPLTVSEVLGQEDLNNLLERHPTIEQKHTKLWLTSRAMLDRVIHNATLARSEFEVRKIHKQICRYVQTSAFAQAEEQLKNERVVMITGPPGVGKTTLANMLLYAYLTQDWQAIVIDRDVEEATSLFQPGVKQMFYFDDFVGATLIGEQVSASDKALLRFIAMMREDPTSRLILTTRDHLYHRARARSERLLRAGLDADQVVLRIRQYTKRQRAQILYNHIYFSDLPSSHVSVLLEGDFYKDIIEHKRFNPRVIEWIATNPLIRRTPAEEYRARITNLLDDPIEIWRHAYEQELSDEARSLLLALWILEGVASLDNLRGVFSKLHAYRAEKYSFGRSPQDFERALREITGSFAEFRDQDMIGIADPSVLDFMGDVLCETIENAVDLLLSASRLSQIDRLWKFTQQKESLPLKRVWQESASRAAPIIKSLLLKKRRIDRVGRVTTTRGPSYEKRLALIVRIAESVGADEYRSLVNPVASTLLGPSGGNDPDINELVALVTFLESRVSKFSALAEPLRRKIFDSIVQGCRFDELCECTRLLGSPPSRETIGALQIGFTEYKEHRYSDELSECRSLDEFDGLIGDLTDFSKSIGVDTDTMIAEAVEARDAFEEEQERNAEGYEDEYKERWRQQSRENENIKELFESLKNR